MVQEAKSFQNIAFMAYFHEIASQKITKYIFNTWHQRPVHQTLSLELIQDILLEVVILGGRYNQFGAKIDWRCINLTRQSLIHFETFFRF